VVGVGPRPVEGHRGPWEVVRRGSVRPGPGRGRVAAAVMAASRRPSWPGRTVGHAGAVPPGPVGVPDRV